MCNFKSQISFSQNSDLDSITFKLFILAVLSQTTESFSSYGSPASRWGRPPKYLESFLMWEPVLRETFLSENPSWERILPDVRTSTSHPAPSSIPVLTLSSSPSTQHTEHRAGTGDRQVQWRTQWHNRWRQSLLVEVGETYGNLKKTMEEMPYKMIPPIDWKDWRRMR